MIIEYKDINGVVFRKEADSRVHVVIPRKNELVEINNERYRVDGVSHEPEFSTHKIHKVTVWLELR